MDKVDQAATVAESPLVASETNAFVLSRRRLVSTEYSDALEKSKQVTRWRELEKNLRKAMRVRTQKGEMHPDAFAAFEDSFAKFGIKRERSARENSALILGCPDELRSSQKLAIAALNEWFEISLPRLLNVEENERKEVDWIREFANIVDPPRSSLRDAFLSDNPNFALELAEELEIKIADASTVRLLGLLLGKHKKSEVQFRLFEKALSDKSEKEGSEVNHFPNDFWLNFRLAQHYTGDSIHHREQHKNFGKAIQRCMTCLTIYPDSPLILSRLGYIYSFRNTEFAKMCFEQVINIDPENYSARANYAETLIRFGQYEQASKEAAIVVKANPKYPFGYELLARALNLTRNYAASEDAFAKLNQLDPTPYRLRLMADTQVRLASELKSKNPNERQKFKDAITTVDRTIAMLPFVAESSHGFVKSKVFLLKSICLWELQDKEAAIETLRDSIANDPDNMGARMKLIDYLNREGNYQAGIEVCEKSIAQLVKNYSDSWANRDQFQLFSLKFFLSRKLEFLKGLGDEKNAAVVKKRSAR